jgi:hypothetical protein
MTDVLSRPPVLGSSGPAPVSKLDALQRVFDDFGRMLNLDANTGSKAWELVTEAVQRSMEVAVSFVVNSTLPFFPDSRCANR